MEKEFYFITNRERTLLEVIENISAHVENIYILVGFFYFSGFFRLQDVFKDKNLRILIGLDIDVRLGRFLTESDSIEPPKQSNQSRSDVKRQVFQKIVDMFSYSQLIDKRDIEQSFQLFVDKIKDGSLELRKTQKPNHAKLYLFEKKEEFSEGDEYPGILITGSSNLSIEGLEKRFEIDIVDREKAHYHEGKKIFDELWEDAVPIVSKQDFEEFKKEVWDKIWVSKLPMPYLIFLRVLKEYFTVKKYPIKLPQEIDPEVMNLKYQTDAIQKAMDVLYQHNGVIIADVVGLGKSIIASTIAHNLNLDTIIITPPHLLDQWKEYKRIFSLRGEIYTSGKIEDAVQDYERKEGEKLIIVDEAHRYRNQETQSYGSLWKLCQGNKVILLTATPFNNTPADIQAMLELFQFPKKTTLKHLENLKVEFSRLIGVYKRLREKIKKGTINQQTLKEGTEKISNDIRRIISPITIRRSRVDLQKIEDYRNDLQVQNIRFPKVNPPALISYSFSPELEEIYLETIQYFIDGDNDIGEKFKSARYKPLLYIANDAYRRIKAEELTNRRGEEALHFIYVTQNNLTKLIKRIFIKRLESSFGSFKQSIENYIKSHEKIKDYYEKEGKVPIYKKFDEIPDYEDISKMDADEIEKIFARLEEKGVIWIEKKHFNDKFIKDLQSDLNILLTIQKKWELYLKSPLENDPKLKELLELVQNIRNKGEKVVIFSEFENTVSYLGEQLSHKNYPVIIYSGSIASETMKQQIRSNFDASYSSKNQKNQYHILITTDILSEGINLHRANHIINYDIPYNPSRVIQRVGRLNRISKKLLHDTIYIYNFFPSIIGEFHTKIKTISTLKMQLIQNIFGEDTQYLTKEEEIKSFFEEEYKKYIASLEEESWDTAYRNLLNHIEKENAQLLSEAEKIPYRTKIRREPRKEKPECIMFARKGTNLIFKYLHHEGDGEVIKSLSTEEAIKIFEASPDEPAFPVSEQFQTKYERLQSSLFITEKLIKLSEKEKKLHNNIDKILEEINPASGIGDLKLKEYVNKLKRILKEIDNIPEFFEKQIRDFDFDNFEDSLKRMEKTLPEVYLDRILDLSKKIELGEDVIIFTEELG